jgi:hypothetical protein
MAFWRIEAARRIDGKTEADARFSAKSWRVLS